MIERTYSGEPPATPFPKGAVDAHAHMFLPGYPAVATGMALPEGLPGPDEYRKVMARLGISRVVIVQGNAHASNHENLLACLSNMRGKARGIAAVTPESDEAELAALSENGVVGTRIMDLPGGAVGLDALEKLDALLAPFGWCLSLQFDGLRMAELEPHLATLKCNFVIDHHGKFSAPPAPDGPEIAALKRLMDRGRCWFKLAGCYETSRDGGPDYADIAAVARAMSAHAPERIIWGTNWPHNLIKHTQDYPDDARLADTVLSWIGDDAARRKMLVDNPSALFGFNGEAA